MTDAEGDELWHVQQALNQLFNENIMWRSNRHVFGRMSVEKRHRWWQSAKKQAEAGAPGMRQLLAKVIEVRMA